MSLLAEPKRKVKWSLNPCGNFWAKDSSKYGQKLLEKMGWQEGKGLGKMENGNTEHVKVAFKQGNTGVGWDANIAQEFVPCQEDFSSLLSSLKQSHTTSNNGYVINSKEQVSLESKSRMCRKRVHYQKFVCGKDVSRYSAKDKECILGKKSESIDKKCFSSVSSASNDEKEEPKKSDAENGVVSSFVTITSSTNMSDYFENMAKRRKFNEAKKDLKANEEIVNDLQVDINSATSELRKENLVMSYTSEFPFPCGTKNSSKRKKKKRLKRKEKKRKRLESDTFVSPKTEVPNGTADPLFDEDEDKHSESGKSSISESSENLNVQLSLKSCLKSTQSQNCNEGKGVPFSESVSFAKVPLKSKHEDISSPVNSEDSGVKERTEGHPSEMGSDSLNDVVHSKKQKDYENSRENKAASIQAYMSVPVFGGSLWSRNNDSWAATLKMAEKMSHYSSVIENIPKHEILCTTNLLDIRGYGN